MSELERAERQARAERWENRFEIPLIVAALATIPALVLYETAAGGAGKTIAQALDWATWVVFLGEVVVMTYVVPDRAGWWRQHPLEVLIVALTGPMWPHQAGWGRVLRLLRLLRLLRVAMLARSAFSMTGVRYAALITLLVIVGAGISFAELEDNASVWDGIWWAWVTMTTVGYGDYYPVTTGGRVIAMTVMIVGIAFATILIGALAQRMVQPEVSELSVVEARLDRIEALLEEISARVPPDQPHGRGHPRGAAQPPAPPDPR